MRKLRAAVVGTGYLGRFHAQKYAAAPDVTLAAVVDINVARAKQIAAESGAEDYTDDYHELIGNVDVASVVVPTSCHYQVTRDLLEAGIHVLVEKPIASTVDEACHLVELSKIGGRILQVGHVERFNPVISALAERVNEPTFIESYRIASFKPRAADINVVLDLMIHDIDLILKLVGAPVERIDASGGSVLSSQIDIANARIQFTTGCVANITASRVSLKSERRMRVFQHNAYLSADLSGQTLDIYHLADTEMFPGVPDIRSDRLVVTPGDALEAEIRAFLASVRGERPTVVTGVDGAQALQTACEVLNQLERQPLAAPCFRNTPSLTLP